MPNINEVYKQIEHSPNHDVIFVHGMRFKFEGEGISLGHLNLAIQDPSLESLRPLARELNYDGNHYPSGMHVVFVDDVPRIGILYGQSPSWDINTKKNLKRLENLKYYLQIIKLDPVDNNVYISRSNGNAVDFEGIIFEETTNERSKNFVVSTDYFGHMLIADASVSRIARRRLRQSIQLELT